MSVPLKTQGSLMQNLVRPVRMLLEGTVRKIAKHIKLYIIHSLCVIYSGIFCLWLVKFVLGQPSKKFWSVKKRDKYPAVLRDPALGRHNCVQLSEVKIHYVENGNPAKPLMLFVHGFPEFWYSWRHQLKEFSDDYWVVALDLRGYGESDKPNRESDYHMSKVLSDIRELVLSLGREKIILVGHDWGGVLSWNFLDLYPEMVERYIIINAPHTHSWFHVSTTNLKQFKASWYCCFFQAPFLPELAMTMYDLRMFNVILEERIEDKAFVEQDLEAYKYMFSKKDAMKYPLDYYRANCGSISLKSKPPDVLPPGLFLFSEKDDYLVLDYLDTVKQYVKNVETKILKDCQHFAPQTHPTAVNAAMREYLNTDVYRA